MDVNAIASHDSSIQRVSETSDSVDVNAIASHDSPIQRLPETSDSSPIQRLPETSDSVDVNAIASHDSSIQRVSETSDSVDVNAIASHDSPIQRLPETSDSGDVNNAIAFHDSPIQRLSETSDSSPIPRLSETSDSGDVNNAIASHDSTIQPQSETSNSGDITDGISDTNSLFFQPKSDINPGLSDSNKTVKEMLINGGIPEIQRFIKNINKPGFITKNNQKKYDKNKPLNKQKLMKNNRHNVDFQPRGVVPQSPDNHQELMKNQEKLGLNQSRLKSLVVPKNKYIPDNVQVSTKGDILSSDFYNKPSSVKEMMQKTIQDRAKLKQQVSSQRSHKVEPLNQQDIYELDENIKAQYNRNYNEQEKAESKQQEVVTSEHLEALAREIYGFICQRFQVERERYGSHRSSGRFPW
ncbi:hypothetical protein SPLC1_S130490 [Arthrospira platensis C1]|nr:hypothetical protein SPLC1_S130490 [Arthrospira platensis C1]